MVTRGSKGRLCPFVVLWMRYFFVLSILVLPLATKARHGKVETKTFKVPSGNLTCEKIAEINKLSLADLLYYNSNLQSLCGLITKPSKVPKGTTINVTPTVARKQTPCTVVYTTVEGDTCDKIASKFSLPWYFLTVATLVKLNSDKNLNCKNPSSRLEPYKLICVERSTEKKNLALEQNYVVKKEDKGCPHPSGKKTTPLDFYYLNPGINCQKLIPGDILRIFPRAIVGCGSICGKTLRLSMISTTPCTDVRTKYYKKNRTIFCMYDKNSFDACNKASSLPKGKVICIP